MLMSNVAVRTPQCPQLLRAGSAPGRAQSSRAMAHGEKLGEKLGMTLRFTEGEWERELFGRPTQAAHSGSIASKGIISPSQRGKNNFCHKFGIWQYPRSCPKLCGLRLVCGRA
jgi:hypothetical protein